MSGDRLRQALEALLSRPPHESREAFLLRHEELRDLLEPMVDAEVTSSAAPDVADDAVTLDSGGGDSACAGRLGRLARHAAQEPRYRVLGEVARGGMGAILRVWDEDLRRKLAMKVILGKGEPAQDSGTPAVSPDVLARFLEEAQVTGQLDHPGIVPVHELGVDGEGRIYFTMRLVQGQDLKAIYELVRTEAEGWSLTRAPSLLLKA